MHEFKNVKNRMKNLFILIVCLFLLFDCKNVRKKYSSEKIEGNEKIESKFPDFNNFLFFKKGTSYTEILNILDNNEINYHNVDLNNIKLYFLDGLPLEYILNSKYRFKVIEGKSLKILNSIIPVFHIGFINDTIFYFRFNSYIKNLRNINDNKGDYSLTEKINNDLYLLKDLNEGLHEKYGPPWEQRGNVNAFNPRSKPWSGIKNSYHEYSIWYNTDSSIKIKLSSFCSRDTILNANFAISYEFYEQQKLISDSNILVIFDTDLYSRIAREDMKMRDIMYEKRNKEIKDKSKRQIEDL